MVTTATKLPKPILPVGRYLARGPKGRRLAEFTEERLNHWVAQFRKMRENGLRIPAPFYHDLTSVPTEKDLSADKNGGYWDNLRVERLRINPKTGEPDSSSPEKPWLVGDLEVAPEVAEKIGVSIKEVSPYFKTEFLDGHGNQYEDVVAHIALVTNPVVPGQPNFSGAGESELVLSLEDNLDNFDPLRSKLLDLLLSNTEELTSESKKQGGEPKEKETEAEAVDMKKLVELLKQQGIALPDDTSEDTLARNLLIAVTALLHEEDDEKKGGLTKPPEGAEERNTPLFMSIDTNSPVFQLANKQARAAYAARIKALVESGRIPAPLAKAELLPKCEDLVLSLSDEGEPQPNELDALLNVLEKLPQNSGISGKKVNVKDGQFKLGSGNLVFSANEEELPPDANELELSNEAIERDIQNQLELAGRTDVK